MDRYEDATRVGSPAACVVQLRYASLPSLLGLVADHYWPGKNSNTFAAWVLRSAGIEYPPGRRVIGWKYRLPR